MKVLITGTSKGIGKATAELFLAEDHEVIGIDREESSISHKNYTHFTVDVRDTYMYPDIKDVEVLINNAGVQNEDDININLMGTINITEKYGIQPSIKSILNVASVSAHNGAEFPVYCASKGGMLAYTKNTALRVAQYGATCNSISPGGVTTELNQPVMDDPVLWKEIMKLTPLKKWASAEEIATWIYFLTVVNKSMTGQDIIIDNGETTDAHFVWIK